MDSKIDLLDKILLVDKPEGITSFQLVNMVKRMARIKKVGHSGTLDKAAEGLMVISTGRATKLSRYFLDSDKSYIAEVKLGVVTDSCDREGNIIATNSTEGITLDDIEKCVGGFKGEISQKPPVYSALKIGGKRASDLAREGKTVDVAPRNIVIKSIELFEYNEEERSFKIKVECSKGTYIRSLARDIGEELGCGAYMSALRRLSSGKFNVEDACTPDELQNNIDGRESGQSFKYTMAEAVNDMNIVVVDDFAKSKVFNGAFFSKDNVLEVIDNKSPYYAILDLKKNLIAIANIRLEDWFIKFLNVFN